MTSQAAAKPWQMTSAAAAPTTPREGRPNQPRVSAPDIRICAALAAAMTRAGVAVSPVPRWIAEMTQTNQVAAAPPKATRA